MTDDTPKTETQAPTHTPGPWRVASRQSDEVHDANGLAVHCDRDFRIPADTARANARLIAAAPEMLETLGKLHALCDELTAAVEMEADDIGGHRGSLAILRGIGPLIEPTARLLHALCDELTAAVEMEADVSSANASIGTDIGGHRGSLAILRDIGPLIEPTAQLLAKARGAR